MKNCRRNKLRQALFFVLLAVVGLSNRAIAQSNFSDWSVPPPLAPGNLTKGSSTGKAATDRPAALKFADVGPVVQPGVGPVQIPSLAAVSNASLLVSAPNQPHSKEAEAGLPDIPLPDAPDASSAPQRSVFDIPVSLFADPPVPTAPELPPLPAEPTVSGQTSLTNSPVPLMPDVPEPFNFSIPPNTAFFIWPTLEVAESTDFKLIIAKEKAVKSGGKKIKRSKRTHAKYKKVNRAKSAKKHNRKMHKKGSAIRKQK